MKELKILGWNIINQTQQPYSHYWELSLVNKEVKQVENINSDEYGTYELNKELIDGVLLIN